ncbi:MAG: PilT/PilU family type 4a pilus ATPase, partial [Oscillospiraceae bacterium]
LPQDVQALLFAVLTDAQIAEVTEQWELDFSYAIVGCARFRGNIIVQRGTFAAVFRIVPFVVPRLEDLSLPVDVSRLCTLTRGLILVTGPTGSGKSTTMAAMIRRINESRAVNVITIEDPIEFLHAHSKATVRQREVGCDTHSFSAALRQSLRHDPDVIMVGEMRDLESISIALTAAETGHLVLSTLHTQTAPLSIARIVDSFPADSKQQVRQQLSGSLRAIIAQQLVPTTDGHRAVAIEYMIDTPPVRTMIRESREHQLYSTMQTSRAQGMQTMDQALAELFKQGRIQPDVMAQYCIDLKEIQRLAAF